MITVKTGGARDRNIGFISPSGIEELSHLWHLSPDRVLCNKTVSSMMDNVWVRKMMKQSYVMNLGPNLNVKTKIFEESPSTLTRTNERDSAHAAHSLLCMLAHLNWSLTYSASICTYTCVKNGLSPRF